MDDDLVGIGELAAAVGRTVSWLRRQADRGAIPFARTRGGHRRFNVEDVAMALSQGSATTLPARLDVVPLQPASPPHWRQRFRLAGLEEDRVWRAVAEKLSIARSGPAYLIVQYAFTEMLNNAIDHSSGTAADVAFWLTPDLASFRIIDDGQGVFQHLRERLELPDHLAAIQELTKGKRTTMSDRHTGEGIFFTSKALDAFQLSSAGLRWTVDNIRGDQAVGITTQHPGTTVFGRISQQTSTELREVFQRFTEDHEFVRTRPVVKLFALGQLFVSRSEAKRILSGLETFTDVDFDFAGVTDVGQGFVDEVFRVWPSLNPGKSVAGINMNVAVEFMVKRAVAATSHSPGHDATGVTEPPYGIEP